MPASAERLAQIDADLDALAADEERARQVVAERLADRPRELAQVDEALAALAEGVALPPPPETEVRPTVEARDESASPEPAPELGTEELSISDLEVPSTEELSSAPAPSEPAPAPASAAPPPIPSEPAPASAAPPPIPSEPAPASASAAPPPIPSEPAPASAAPPPPPSEPAAEAPATDGLDAADLFAQDSEAQLDDDLGDLLDDELGADEPVIQGGGEFDEDDSTGIFSAADLAAIERHASEAPPATPAADDEIELLVDDDFDLVIDDGELEIAADEGPAETDAANGSAAEDGDEAEKGFFKKLFG